MTSPQAIHYGVWHCFTFRQWGRAIKLLSKLGEERPARDVDERLAEAAAALRWGHVAELTRRALPAKYPASYRPF